MAPMPCVAAPPLLPPFSVFMLAACPWPLLFPPSSASVATVSELPHRTGSAMARKKVALDFEQSLAELQQLVERLESGELSLEDSLTCFEQCIGLTRDCQAALSQAEQKLQILQERAGKQKETPLEEEPEA